MLKTTAPSQSIAHSNVVSSISFLKKRLEKLSHKINIAENYQMTKNWDEIEKLLNEKQQILDTLKALGPSISISSLL